MNLKYYLRGLGIGLVVTTIILTISHNIEGPALVENQTTEQQESTGSIIAYTKATETESASQTQNDSEAQSESKTESESPAQTNSQATTAPQSTPAKEEQTTVGETSSNTVVLTISLGDYSGKVSKMLYELGAIADREAFDNYLSETGYSRKLKVGVYTITIGDSYENIAKIITQTK